jgi:hypothetical protein
MRVLRILFASVIPLVFASVSQAQAPNSQGAINGQGHDAAHCAMRAALHPGEPINKCEPAPTPPPSTCASTGALALGPVSISGKVTNSLTGAALANWCVEVFGTLSAGGTLSATMPTDASGNYAFTGLPYGTYSVCIDVQSGWTLGLPWATGGCPGGTLYQFVLDAASFVAGFVDFRLHL